MQTGSVQHLFHYSQFNWFFTYMHIQKAGTETAAIHCE